MATLNYSKRYVVQDYSKYSQTKVPLDGENIYFHSVITGQVKDVHLMGDGSSQINQLPFTETLEIHSSSNVDLEDLRITGNRVKIYNSGSTAITVQTGVTGTLIYENINAKCTSQAFFDGTYWRVEDGSQIGDMKPWHKNFGAGTQSLPWGWVEMDGTVISDSESPFDGETLEDLNGDARFLRGAATSGTEQADAFQGHAHGDGTNINKDDNNMGGGASEVVRSTGGGVAQQIMSDGVNGTPRTASETRPINMSVVWIMKIK